MAGSTQDPPGHPASMSYKIMDLDRRCRGVFKSDGQTFKVPGALPGERVRVQLPAKQNHREAELVEVIEPSPLRQSSECNRYNQCPGCVLRHVDPATEIEVKSKQALKALEFKSSDGFERFAQFHRDSSRTRTVSRALRADDGKLVLGMRRTKETEIVPMDSCPVQTQINRTLIAQTQEALNHLGLQPYDGDERTGDIRHVIVEAPSGQQRGSTKQPYGFSKARITLAFGRPGPWAMRLQKFLVDEKEVSLAIDVLPFRSAGLYARPKVIRGHNRVWLPLGPVGFGASPTVWTPTNLKSAETLTNVALKWLDPHKNDRLLEIGCGMGTSSITFGKHCHVVGIDQNRLAVEDALFNAHRHGIEGAEFYQGRAEHALLRFAKKNERFDLLCLHAMRLAYGQRTMSLVKALKPRKILYIAPNARSLHEDLAHLAGYEITRLGGLDQMPGTRHLLTIALLQLTRTLAEEREGLVG